MWRPLAISVALASSVLQGTGAFACGGMFDVLCNIGDEAKRVGARGRQDIENAGTQLDQLGRSLTGVTKQTFDNVVSNLRKAGSDISNNLNKAVDDTVRTYAKAVNDVMDAEKATLRFVQRQVEGTPAMLQHAADRAQQGKVFDAVWHLGTEPFQQTSENASKLAQESDLAREAGAAAAGFYGGPAGSAAYAAWYAYSQNKDANMALRVGLMAGASRYAGSLSAMPTDTVGEVMKKAVVTGALGGLSVAAAGGDQKAVENAFLRSGSMVLVQSAQAYVNEQVVNPAIAEVDQYCTSATGYDCSHVLPEIEKDARGQVKRDAEGNALLSKARLLEWRRDLGTWNAEDPNRARAAEQEFTRPHVFQFKDWAVSYDRGALMANYQNLPAVTLTYIGPGSHVATKLEEMRQAIAPGVERDRQLATVITGGARPAEPAKELWVAVVNPATGAPFFDRPESSRMRGELVIGEVLRAAHGGVRVRRSPDASRSAVDSLHVGDQILVSEIRDTREGSDSTRWARFTLVERAEAENAIETPRPAPRSRPVAAAADSTAMWCADSDLPLTFEIGPTLAVRGITGSARGRARPRSRGGFEVRLTEDQSLLDLIHWDEKDTYVVTTTGRLFRYDGQSRLIAVGSCRTIAVAAQ